MKPDKPQLATELTPIGEQYVIPGCERDKRKGNPQFNLWDSGSFPSQITQSASDHPTTKDANQ